MIQKCFKEINVGTYSKSLNTIRNLTGGSWKNKKRGGEFDEAGSVYAIPCNNCNNIYIGQTGRSLKERLKEHERAIRGKYNSNALYRHQSETNHCCDITKTKMVEQKWEKNEKSD